MNKIVIKADEINFQYGKHLPLVLQDFNLEITENSFFGLLGPNGCGKTTLISILTGLRECISGKVLINGLDISRSLTKIKQLIGLVPQEIALYDSLSLYENLNFFGKLYGFTGKELKKRVEYCLQIANLDKVKYTAIRKFSGGMKRRANLVLSLLHNPRVLFMDEPTVNVDPQSRNMIFETLKRLNEEGITIVYTTQYLEEAENLCSEVAIMDAGKIIRQDTPDNLVKSVVMARNLGDVFLELTGRYLRD